VTIIEISFVDLVNQILAVEWIDNKKPLVVFQRLW